MPTVALHDFRLNCREMQLTWSSGTLKAIFVTVRIWAGIWLQSWLEKMASPQPCPPSPPSLCSTQRGRGKNGKSMVWIICIWCHNRKQDILSLELQLWVLWQLVFQLHRREVFIWCVNQSSHPTVTSTPDKHWRGISPRGCIITFPSMNSCFISVVGTTGPYFMESLVIQCGQYCDGCDMAATICCQTQVGHSNLMAIAWN